MKKIFLQYSNYSITKAKKDKKLNEKKSENFNNMDILSKLKQNTKNNQFIENEIRMLNKRIKTIKIELDNLKKSRIFQNSSKQKNQKTDW
ncbi:MAG: hypothetical protein QXF12_04335 [Candidatus Aenigmatarchaeota archaeon]